MSEQMSLLPWLDVDTEALAEQYGVGEGLIATALQYWATEMPLEQDFSKVWQAAAAAGSEASFEDRNPYFRYD